jgi:hypothetical protein
VTDEPSDASETAHDMQSSDDHVIHFFASLDCLVKTSLNLHLMAINKVDYPLDCIAHFITLTWSVRNWSGPQTPAHRIGNAQKDYPTTAMNAPLRTSP